MKARPSSAFVLAAVMVSLLMLPAGCGGGGEGTIAEVTLGNVALQEVFALYYPVSASATPRVPEYSVRPDLGGVAGAGAVNLSAEARQVLATRGFVAVSGESRSICEAYRAMNGAKFVTVEALLDAYHSIYSYALRRVEEDFLAADLRGLVEALYGTMKGFYRGGEGAVRDAALELLSYLGVAAGLFELEVEVPAGIEDKVEEELALISGHEGMAVSPVTGYREDYGRYEPRGHYKGNAETARYFKAMTWLGGAGVYSGNDVKPWDSASGMEMTRQSLLLVAALHEAQVSGESAYVVWDRIHQPVTFLGGFAGGFNAYAYTRLMRDMLGGRFQLSELEDDALVGELMQRLREESMRGVAELAGVEAGGVEAPAAFHLFGRPEYAWDAITRQLVSPEVPERYMPRGLDLPAALGSERALNNLYQVYGENEYEGYEERMEELRTLLKEADPSGFRASAYWSCLDILRLAFKPGGEGYPYFMRGDAWQDRCLYAFMGSWARFSHDGVASAVGGLPAEADGGEEASPARGYVEPYPEAFARLAALADMTRRGLEERGLATGAVLERLEELYELLLDLKVMAEKELRGEALDEGEYAAIDRIGGTLHDLATFPLDGEDGEVLETVASPPLVDDIYAGGEYGEILQAAVGGPVIYYVIAPIGGGPALVTGAGFSYYEFVKPADGGFDDAAWLEAVDTGRLPEVPAWTGSFLR